MRPALWTSIFYIAAALLVLSFGTQAALPGRTLHTLFSTFFWLGGFFYVLLFVSYIFVPEPPNGRPWLYLAFWFVVTVLIFSMLSPIPLSGSGPLVGDFLFFVGPVCPVLLLFISSLTPQSRNFLRSPVLLVGILLAGNPIWALPILDAARKFEGENSMGQLLYWLFYLPLGVFTITAAVMRSQVRKRQARSVTDALGTSE